jgi:exodeoxyribonuclease V beta subunit
VNAVNTLFLAHPDPFLSAEIPFYPVRSGRRSGDTLLCDGTPPLQPLHLWVYTRDDDSTAEAKQTATDKIVQAVAAEIARLLEQGSYSITVSGTLRPLTPGDIAVLVKTHKQASHVQQALQTVGIPSVQHGSATIFETGEALDLLRILRGAAEPGRGRALREALLTSSIGLTANEIADYVESSGEHPDWEEWLLRFRDMGMAAHSGGIIALAARLLGNCGLRKKLLTRIGGERSLTNILHCVELLHQAELEHGKSLAASISWLERRIADSQKDETALLRLESDDNAVRISTIHASKGLEYPVVFLPFAWDPPSGNSGRVIFHDNDGRLVLDLAADDGHKQLARRERDAEAARLLYVALTRAEFRCYVVWGCIKGAADSPLFNLLHGSRGGKSFATLNDQAILDDIRTMSGSGESFIAAELMPPCTGFAGYHDDTKRVGPYICRTLGHPPADNWRVSSFSGMISGTGHTFQPRDHDNLPIETSPDSTSGTESFPGGVTIFEFPRGARAGTCLHEIFEQLDFAALRNEHITNITRNALAANGYTDRWLPVVSTMVSEVAAARIIPGDPDFSLSQLKRGGWQSEMEFYLPVRELAPETLRSLFRGLLDDRLFGDFHEVLDRLLFQRSHGMLQGFIDLLFVHNGRYYILDWKSNHLGSRLNDYGAGEIQRAMCRSAYILQYHLYTLALDRLLKLRLPGYDYETHFGGVVYLFLRGISSARDTGVYYDRPSPEFIKRANEMMLAPGQDLEF